MALEKVKTLGPREHSKCSPDHMLILVTQPDGTRYPMESCGKINWYLQIMKQKYGWKLETIGMYNRSNVEILRKRLEEQDERAAATKDEVKAEDGSS